jgi:hypothetical protein
MLRPLQRERLFSAERWRKSRDLRIDLGYIVAAIAILAGTSALDRSAPANAPVIAQDTASFAAR